MIEKSQEQPPSRELTLSQELRAECEAMIARFPQKQGALLNVLRLLEKEFQYLDPPAIKIAAELCDTPASKVYGMVSFYSTFRTDKDGKNILWVCSTLPCALRGSQALYERLEQELELNEYNTTPDGLLSLKKAECIGACGTAPCLQLNDDYYENLDPDQASRIVKDLISGNSQPAGYTA